jgi:uncharacterized membrane protein YkoI
VLSLTLAGASHAHSDHDEAFALRAAGKILPLSLIIERARAIHPGELLEAEFLHGEGRYIYEVEIGGYDGHYYELYFDATTGELLPEQ